MTSEGRKLSIAVDVNTSKLQLRLKAIAKHAEALTIELDKIDNMFMCDCGSTGFTEVVTADNKVVTRVCEKCGEEYFHRFNKDEE